MAPQSEQTRSYTTFVLFIICVGSFLRIYNFWVPPIWVDEYGTWWVVAANTWSEVIERTLRIQGQSPLYYLLVRLVAELGGYGVFQLRLLSVVFGIATLAFVNPLAVKIFDDRRVALICLIIFAMSESFIWYSQIARPYSLALFFSLISFWSFLSLEKTNTEAFRVVYVLSTALSIYGHYLFGSIVMIQVLHLVVRQGYRSLLSKFWLTTFLVLAILLVPASTQVLHLVSRRHALDWVTSVDSSWKIAGGIIYLLGGSSPLAILGMLIAALSLGFNWEKLKRSDVGSNLTLPVIWYVVPFILFSIVPILIGVNLAQPRYLLFAYPATYLLLAWLMLNVRVSGYRSWLPTTVFITATIIFVSIPALSSTQTFARWPNRAWNDALASLSQLYQSDGLVVAQVGLVEADLLGNGNRDPTLLSYLSWPLVTSLPGLRRENIAILPSRLTHRTEVYFDSLVSRAAKHPRIWLVGGGETVALFHDRLIEDLNYKVTIQYNRGGKFHVFLFEHHTFSKSTAR